MITIRRLEKGDDLSKFSSGEEQLDHFLKRNGLANQNRYGVTYVALDDGLVVGYATVAPTSVSRDRIKRVGPHMWPALLLARLAVDKSRQQQGIGRELMRHVFQLALDQHQTLGCFGVIVDSKPKAVEYYEKLNFKRMTDISTELSSGQVQMYIAMETVVQALDPSIPK